MCDVEKGTVVVRLIIMITHSAVVVILNSHPT